MKRNFNTTPCSSVHFNFYAPASSRYETAVSYIDALRDYWFARADLAQMLSGRLPRSGDTATQSSRGTIRKEPKRRTLMGMKESEDE